MRSHIGIVSATLLVALTGISIAQDQTPVPAKSLGEVARELREQKKAETTASAPALSGTTAVVADRAAEDEFRNSVLRLMVRENFAGLDELADGIRTAKARWPGGAWKLFTFYETLQQRAGGSTNTDAEWQRQLAFLNLWVAKRPKSITARVALADFYFWYAWQARGPGYANSVTPEGALQFDNRLDKAARILVDAASVGSMCPHWYMVFERVTRSKGLERQQLDAVFEKAIAFSPDYYYLYQEHAFAILPKWGGQPGAAGAFASEMYRRIGGKEGAFIYFEIASSLCRNCGDFQKDEFSWQRIQRGFAAMQELYGVSQLKANQYAFMAVTYDDRDTAAQALKMVGPLWDPSIWGSRAQLDLYRQWAGLPPLTNSIVTPAPPPSAPPMSVQRATTLIDAGQKAMLEGRFDDARKSLRDAIQQANTPEAQSMLAQAYISLAQVDQQQGAPEKADAVLAEGYAAIVKRKNGKDSEDAARLLHERSITQSNLSHFDAAEEDLRESVRVREKLEGESSPLLVPDLAGISSMCIAQKKYDDALTAVQRAIKIQEVQSHPETMLAGLEQSAGLVYERMGKYDDAEAAYLRALNLDERVWGPNHVILKGPLGMLARLYRHINRADDANKVEQRADSLR